MECNEKCKGKYKSFWVYVNKGLFIIMYSIKQKELLKSSKYSEFPMRFVHIIQLSWLLQTWLVVMGGKCCLKCYPTKVGKQKLSCIKQ